MLWSALKIINIVCHLTRLGTNTLPITAIALTFHSAVPVLAHRNTQERCWARFDLSSNSALCIPRRLWEGRFSPEGDWKGRWKAYSPAELGVSAPKTVFYRFYATE